MEYETYNYSKMARNIGLIYDFMHSYAIKFFNIVDRRKEKSVSWTDSNYNNRIISETTKNIATLSTHC